jgi:HlyD family secretion protein
MNFKLGKYKTPLLTLIVLGAIGGTAGYFYFGRKATAEEYITAKIERGNVRNTVSATGALQAVTTVQVGSQVSGIIKALYVDFNSNVRRGQVVAQLDPSIFQAQVAQQRANVEAARANLADAQARLVSAEVAIDSQRANVGSASANLEALKAQRDDAKSALQRQEGLAAAGIINQRDLDIARTTLQSAEARYNQAVSQVAQARATELQATRSGIAQANAAVKQAQAQVQQTEASLRLAEVNLSHTTIASPIDGVVVSRNVDVGQTVAASLSAPTLFTIANDLTQMQVIANIDQADIGVINAANKIGFTVDAFPGQTFNGTISQIRLNPVNTQNVVTYNVVIDVQNPDLKLKPGMTANLTITIAERQNVLKVPNAALRFRPADMTPEKMRELFSGGREGGGGNAGEQRKQGEAPAAAPGNAEKPAANAEGGQRPAGAQRGEGRSGERGEGRSGERGKGGAAGADPNQNAAGAQRGGDAAGGGGRRNAGGGGANAGGGGGANAGGGSLGGMQTAAVVQGQRRVVWVLGPDGKPQPRRIRLGITDGASTEIAEGDLKEGEAVITAQNSANANRANPTSSRPPGFGGGMGGPGGGGGGRGPR